MPFAPLIALVMMVTLPLAVRVMRARLRAAEAHDRIRVGRLVNHTGLDAETGSVYSIQTASITTPTERLDEVWTTDHLEQLARSYWLFMEKITLGLVRVHYDARGRYVCFLTKRLPLLGFSEPEYEFGDGLGVVRWPIDRGLLISRKGRGRGYLEIEVHRRDGVGDDAHPMSRAYVELEVAGFYPTMSSGLAYWVYKQTQSRFHVLLAYGFIRSLSTERELAPTRTGRLARALRRGDPPPERIPDGQVRETDGDPPEIVGTPRGPVG